MKNEDEKPSKGILQTGAKPNTSKSRRISWGEVKIKEFAKHDEVNNKSGDEYNMALHQYAIKEEKKESDSFILDESNAGEISNLKEDFRTISNFVQNFGSNNLISNQVEDIKKEKSNPNSINIVNDKSFNYFGLNMGSDNYLANNSNTSSNIFKNITKNSNNNLGVVENHTPNALNGNKDLQFIMSGNVNNNFVGVNTSTGNNNILMNAKDNTSGLIDPVKTIINETGANNINNFTSMSNINQNHNVSQQENTTAGNPFTSKNNIANNSTKNYFSSYIEDSDGKAESSNKNVNRITLQGAGDVFEVNNINFPDKSIYNLNEVTKILTNITSTSSASHPIKADIVTANLVNKQNNNFTAQTESSRNQQTIKINPVNNTNNIFPKREELNKVINNSNNNPMGNSSLNLNPTNFSKLSKKTFESDEKSSYNEDKSAYTNRMTINLRDHLKTQLQSNKDSSDSDLEENLKAQSKRFTINLKDTLKLLYDDEEEDDLNNSLEQRLELRRESNISASPINIKNQKLYYETCLSSASRCIETTEAKQNNNIHENIGETNRQLQFENKINFGNNNSNKDLNNITSLNIVMNESEEETPKFENENETGNKTRQRITITEIFHDSNKKEKEIYQKSPVQLKNPAINANNLVSPMNVNFGISKMNNENDVDKRLNDLLYVLSESNKVKQKNIVELDKIVNELTAKLNEFNEEQNKIKIKKQQIKENLEKLDQESIILQETKVSYAFPLKCFGVKVLSSDFNTLKIQLLNRINLSFEFKEFSKKMFKKSNCETEIMKLEKIKFDIIKANSSLGDKIIDNSIWHKLIRNVYEDIYGKIFNSFSEFNLSVFKEKLKLLLKNSGSFLYFLEIFNTICTVGLEVNLRYIKENMSSIIQFSMFNRLGYKVVFLFEIEICNSFYGVNYRDSQIVNISLSEPNFAKSKSKTQSFMEEVKKFLNFKEKLKNPVFFKEFLFKLNENILNL